MYKILFTKVLRKQSKRAGQFISFRKKVLFKLANVLIDQCALCVTCYILNSLVLLNFDYSNC